MSVLEPTAEIDSDYEGYEDESEYFNFIPKVNQIRIEIIKQINKGESKVAKYIFDKIDESLKKKDLVISFDFFPGEFEASKMELDVIFSLLEKSNFIFTTKPGHFGLYNKRNLIFTISYKPLFQSSGQSNLPVP